MIEAELDAALSRPYYARHPVLELLWKNLEKFGLVS
jgi:hypothetical protein